MFRTEAVRQREVENTDGTWTKFVERLWIGETLQDPSEWRVEDEAPKSVIPDFDAVQSSKAWPFPKSAS